MRWLNLELFKLPLTLIAKDDKVQCHISQLWEVIPAEVGGCAHHPPVDQVPLIPTTSSTTMRRRLISARLGRAGGEVVI